MWEPRKSLYERTGMGGGHERYTWAEMRLYLYAVNVPPPRVEGTDDMRLPVQHRHSLIWARGW